jgi:hypothetical protein
MPYYDFVGREIEDPEMDAYLEDLREYQRTRYARANHPDTCLCAGCAPGEYEWTDEEVASHDCWLASQEGQQPGPLLVVTSLTDDTFDPFLDCDL